MWGIWQLDISVGFSLKHMNSKRRQHHSVLPRQAFKSDCKLDMSWDNLFDIFWANNMRVTFRHELPWQYSSNIVRNVSMFNIWRNIATHKTRYSVVGHTLRLSHILDAPFTQRSHNSAIKKSPQYATLGCLHWTKQSTSGVCVHVCVPKSEARRLTWSGGV